MKAVGELACAPPPQPASNPAVSSAVATAPQAGRRTRPLRRWRLMGTRPGGSVAVMRLLIFMLIGPPSGPRLGACLLGSFEGWRLSIVAADKQPEPDQRSASCFRRTKQTPDLSRFARCTHPIEQ